MKKKILLFLNLFFTLFFVHQKTYAGFFEPSPVTQNYGNLTDHAYAAHWNQAGTFLAVGGINYPADVTIYQWDTTSLNPCEIINFGSGAYTVNWNPNGRYLAVGGNHGYNNLIIYNWDGATLTLTTSKYHGTQVNATAWSPNGNYLAVGGNWGTQDLAVYSWDGTSILTPKTTKSHGTQVNALAWHPNGTKLAVAGNNSSQDLILYSWDGATLTSLNTQDHGTEACALAWTSTGSWLAVGGDYGSNNVALYTLSGPSTLTLTTSVYFGTKARTLDWSFDDTYLTVGGDNGSLDVTTYKWDGKTLAKVYDSQTNYGNGAYSVNWSPYADHLAVAGDNSLNDVSVYANHGYLNGTQKKVTLSDHYIFTHGGYALDNVNFANGCTVLPAQTLKLALLTPLAGALDLRSTGILQLEKDVYLDANFTLSSGGVIDSKNHALYLGNNLTIPDNSIIYIASNTIIDGCGHNLKLGHRSQLFVDSNVTLTLRNLTLENTLNTTNTPPIQLAALTSKLALDTVEIAPSSDFYFTQGKLFIHNDVAFTGTSKFFYNSICPNFITQNATLYFDHDTTLDYAPTSSNNNLFVLQDQSASIYLNGSTLQVTHTGMRLTKGKLWFDNNITLTSPHTQAGAFSNSGSAPVVTQAYGTEAKAVAWSHDNSYLAIGGADTVSEINEVQIFKFNGASLSLVASYNFGTLASGATVWSVAWSLDGKYLAIGGQNPADGNEIHVVRFDGASLTKINDACKDFGTTALAVAWSPDGNYLAVGGEAPTDGTNQIQVFSFDGSSLVKINNACKNFGNFVSSVAWAPNGNYLAVGGNSPTDTINQIQIFSFDGSTLTKIDTACQSFGIEGNTIVNSVSWSPDGMYLATGGVLGNSDNQIQIFKFKANTLIALPAAVYSIGTGIEFHPSVKSITWSPTGRYLAAGCYLPDDDKEIRFFSFDGTTLNQITNACKHFGDTVNSTAWNPDERYLAVGGYLPDTGTGHTEAEIYTIGFSPSFQSTTNSLIFGNSALGSAQDLNIKLLGGANVNVYGIVKYDCTN